MVGVGSAGGSGNNSVGNTDSIPENLSTYIYVARSSNRFLEGFKEQEEKCMDEQKGKESDQKED